MVNGGQRSRADTKTAMPRTPTLLGIKSSIQDQMAALQQKIQLLEYDHIADQESASHTIKVNQETIKLLQQENKKLNQELAEEKQRQVDRETKSGHVIVQLKEGKLHDSIKRFNALCHQAQVRIKRLEELESMIKQNAAVQNNNEATQEEQIQHHLENKLEEARLKLQDIEHINSIYNKITTHLQEEMATYQPQIQQLETEILVFGNELKDVKTMKKNAVVSRDKAWAEYRHQKKEYRCKHSSREQILRNLTHQAKERRHYKKEQAKSVVFIEVQAPTDAYEVPPAQEEEERICTYEQALENIKEAIGVTSKSEVIQRFINQGEKRKYLEKEKLKAETTLSELKDKQKNTDNALQELKYSAQAKLQAKLSNNLKTLEELRTRLHLETKKQDKFKMNAEEIAEVLNKAKSEVKRLAIRLRHLKLPGTSFPVKDLSLDLHALDLLAVIGQKLQNLQKQLEGEDIDEIFREMKSKEYLETIERNLPVSNLRISLLSPTKEETSDDEDSGEDDEVMTRESIKKLSQQISLFKRKANIWCEKWVK
ncbi:outer dynein arm-docking complex subunit 3-like [Bufo bufo]|uniref:outer dynein arm-docking complex subunit 3-like n=1 Tax=Bufo bufo TaxID=8384 RepID=UPI001ABE51B4|nr:outer dynein arm-docking complex subunit 3-like [Bufo bufo]XP_040275825.1 outer dynein arm-docking complex subunit 3-like [Bufo bufo]